MSRRRKTAVHSFKPSEEVTLGIKIDGELANVLTSFAEDRLQCGGGEANAAHAAAFLVEVALCNYDHTITKCQAIQNYCEAEQVPEPEYRKSIIRAKFPKGRLPKARSC